VIDKHYRDKTLRNPTNLHHPRLNTFSSLKRPNKVGREKENELTNKGQPNSKLGDESQGCRKSSRVGEVNLLEEAAQSGQSTGWCGQTGSDAKTAGEEKEGLRQMDATKLHRGRKHRQNV